MGCEFSISRKCKYNNSVCHDKSKQPTITFIPSKKVLEYNRIKEGFYKSNCFRDFSKSMKIINLKLKKEK